MLPVGQVCVRCEPGGLAVTVGGETVVLAGAAVIVKMDLEKSGTVS